MVIDYISLPPSTESYFIGGQEIGIVFETGVNDYIIESIGLGFGQNMNVIVARLWNVSITQDVTLETLVATDSFTVVCPLAQLGPRADSKSQRGFGSGWRIAIARSAVMSCIKACIAARID